MTEESFLLLEEGDYFQCLEIESKALSGQIVPEQHILPPRSRSMNIGNAKLGQGEVHPAQNSASD